MFAVIKTGGKQYPVRNGSVLKVEKIEGKIGGIVTIEDVILVNNNGTLITKTKNFMVKAEILEQKKNKKVIIFKKRRRKNYKRKNGHRQSCTVLKVINVEEG